MNISKDDPAPLTDIPNFRFSLGVVEVALAILVSIATWFALRNGLQSALPFPCGSSLDCGWTYEQAWQILGHPLFVTYSVPVSLLLGISTIFLVQLITRRNVQLFSALGKWALAWPLFSFLGFGLLSVFGLICFAVGVPLAIIATITSVSSKHHKWNWISLPLNLTWFFVFGKFVGEFLSLYGD